MLFIWMDNKSQFIDWNNFLTNDVSSWNLLAEESISERKNISSWDRFHVHLTETSELLLQSYIITNSSFLFYRIFFQICHITRERNVYLFNDDLNNISPLTGKRCLYLLRGYSFTERKLLSLIVHECFANFYIVHLCCSCLHLTSCHFTCQQFNSLFSLSWILHDVIDYRFLLRWIWCFFLCYYDNQVFAQYYL